MRKGITSFLIACFAMLGSSCCSSFLIASTTNAVCACIGCVAPINTLTASFTDEISSAHALLSAIWCTTRTHDIFATPRPRGSCFAERLRRSKTVETWPSPATRSASEPRTLSTRPEVLHL